MRRRAAIVSAAAALLQFHLAAFALELPSPTGPYAVGTATYHWVDRLREEVMTPDPADRRELMVQIWYPAQRTEGTKPTPYFPDFERMVSAGKTPTEREYARLFKASGYGRFKSLMSHAVLGAKLPSDPQRYPLLIFSPGNFNPRSIYTTQMEELASQGYIIAAIDHPYSCAFVVFPDGRAALSPPDRRDVLPFEQRIRIRAADIRFVLDELTSLDAADGGGPFAGRLDLSRVGVFGHSLGGVAAAEACSNDRRFRACANLDGGTGDLVDSVQRGFEQPFLLMTKALPAGSTPSARELASWGMSPEDYSRLMERDEQRKAGVLATLRSSAYRVVIKGAKHDSFSDVTLLERDDSGVGARKGLRIVSDYTLAFFDSYLRGRRSALLERAGSERYPDVLLEIYEPSPRE